MSAAEFKAEGNKALGEKRFDDAIASYTKAIELDSSDHTFFSNRSAAYLSKGDAENALKDAESCIGVKSDWAKGYVRKGAALHKLMNYEASIEAYEAGLKIAPDDAALKSGLADVQKVASSSGGPMGGGPGGLFGPQMFAKLAGHPKFGPKLADPAFQMKLKMLQTNPNAVLQDPEMMEVLQAVLQIPGMGGDGDNGPPPFASSPAPAPAPAPEPEPEPEPELTDEQKAVKAKKDEADAVKARGNELYKAKKFDEAIAAYDEAFSIDANMMYMNNKAAVYIEKGEPDEAIEICNKALEHGKANGAPFEDRAKVYHRIAGAYLKKDDINAAIESYQKGQLENFDKAIERKIKNLELDARKKERAAYINPALGLEAKERGNAKYREGDYPGAIAEYEEAIKRDPNNAPFRNNLANTFLKMGLFNDAKREVEKALEIDENYVKAWSVKGNVETVMKEYHKAIESYKKGLSIESDNPLCKEGLQKVMMKIHSSQSEEDIKQRQAHAMADPEIQQILADPSIRQFLQDQAENPKYAQQALQDPHIANKINKLIAAGILQMG